MMELSECLYRPGLWLHLKPLKPLKDRTIHQTRVIFKAESVMGDGGGKKKRTKIYIHYIDINEAFCASTCIFVSYV